MSPSHALSLSLVVPLTDSCVGSLSHSLTCPSHSLSLTHSLSWSLTHSLTLWFSPSLDASDSLTLVLPLTRPPSHCLARCVSLTCCLSLSLNRCLSQCRCPSHARSLSLTRCPSHSLLSLSLVVPLTVTCSLIRTLTQNERLGVSPSARSYCPFLTHTPSETRSAGEGLRLPSRPRCNHWGR